jgi:hypothetical protein
MTLRTPTPLAKYDIRVSSLDLSQLVGFQVRLFSRQFPGKELYARVAAATGQRLMIEGGAPTDPIHNLVNHQTVVIQFAYRNEQVSAKAQLQKSGTRFSLELDESATPLSQRRFLRAEVNYRVNLASFTPAGLMGRRLDRLRWMETDAVNFSAGGALINVPTILHDTVRLLIIIEQKDYQFPSLVLGRVCHGYQYDELNCRAGIEFVTQESAQKMFSPFQASEMPPVLFSYTGSRRERLNRAILEKTANTQCQINTGVDHENG